MLLLNRECQRKVDLFEVVRWRIVPGRKKVEVAEWSRHQARAKMRLGSAVSFVAFFSTFWLPKLACKHDPPPKTVYNHNAVK